eukprot:3625656-Rhodomonas_salina.1
MQRGGSTAEEEEEVERVCGGEGCSCEKRGGGGLKEKMPHGSRAGHEERRSIASHNNKWQEHSIASHSSPRSEHSAGIPQAACRLAAETKRAPCTVP